MKVAACIILYEPDINVLKENIITLLPEIELLILIDNSSAKIDLNQINISHIDFLKIEYHFKGRNVGIAKALNDAIKIADNVRCDYIFTFDQDSRPSKHMILLLKKTVIILNKDKQNDVIIVSPKHIEEKYAFSAERRNKLQLKEVETVMTSGNLLNIKLYKKTGGFREDFFIDFVDHEFCLRAKTFGFKIFVNTAAVLIHNLGNSQKKYIGNKVITITHHNFIRRYYMTRNRLEIHRLYRQTNYFFIQKDRIRMVNEFFKIILFEKDKFKKINSIIKGFSDFFKHKFRRYD